MVRTFTEKVLECGSGVFHVQKAHLMGKQMLIHRKALIS